MHEKKGLLEKNQMHIKHGIPTWYESETLDREN